jgi:hypothetical protein
MLGIKASKNVALYITEVHRRGTLGGASTFRTIDFVTTDAHEINFHVVDIKWDFSNSLGCISMEIHLSGTANLP